MTVNASDRTLGIINIWQVLRKLHWEIELIKAIPERLQQGLQPVDVLHVQDAKLYATINAASTSLSLVDWLFHTLNENPPSIQKLKEYLPSIETNSDKDFLKFLRKENSSINACHQVCNANKHFHLKTPDNEFKAMVFEVIEEHPDGKIEVNTIPQIMWNGSDPAAGMSALAMLEGVATWWEDLFVHINISGREQFF